VQVQVEASMLREIMRTKWANEPNLTEADLVVGQAEITPVVSAHLQENAPQQESAPHCHDVAA